MSVDLDSSALVKLVTTEAESKALRRFLRQHPTDRRVTSTLARVEVVRAVAAGGPSAVAHARRQLARLDQITIDRDLLDAAATLVPGTILRSLDAIHLAAAQALGASLKCVLTYDRRMQDAATALGIVVDAAARCSATTSCGWVLGRGSTRSTRRPGPHEQRGRRVLPSRSWLPTSPPDPLARCPRPDARARSRRPVRPAAPGS